MGLFNQRRRHAVGSKEERMKLRGVFIGGLVGILALAAVSTHPHAIKAAKAVHSSPLFPRTLISLPDKFFDNARADPPLRRFLDAADQIQTCFDDHPEECGDPADVTVGALPPCLVDEEQGGACCIPLDKANNSVTDFDDADRCITNEDEFCAPDDLCVAELVPGSGIGAECFQEFEENGGIALYLFLIIYLFIGLAIVCDDYFSYALDMLGDLLGISSDVKGATFAAIGSSAPELFVSIADNVVSNPPKSVGVGTIVGSAIFNILVIIGASAVVAGRNHGGLNLNWRPLTRDSFFYVISIAGLVGVAVTGDEAEHYEGAILLLLYLWYLVFMYYNQQIFDKVDAKLGLTPKPIEEAAKKEEAPIAAAEIANVEPDEENVDEDVKKLEGEEKKAETEDENDPKDFVRQASTEHKKSGFHMSSASRRNLKRSANTMSRERRASLGSAIGKGKLEEEDVENEPYWSALYWPMYDPNEELPQEADRVVLPFASRAFGGGKKMWLSRAYYLLVFPINFFFRITIPDSRYDLFKEDKPGVKNHRPIAYWVEFLLCILWIGLLSHFLVFSAAKFGCLVGIAPSVMGLTVLAAGTSIPDTITSMILTKNGEGDAAVANCIGSNVFNILVGLGLPWFLAGFIYDGSAVATGDIGISIVFLVGVLIVLIVALFITKFKLTSLVGYVFLILYLFYVCFELFIRPAAL